MLRDRRRLSLADAIVADAQQAVAEIAATGTEHAAGTQPDMMLHDGPGRIRRAHESMHNAYEVTYGPVRGSVASAIGGALG